MANKVVLLFLFLLVISAPHKPPGGSKKGSILVAAGEFPIQVYKFFIFFYLLIYFFYQSFILIPCIFAFSRPQRKARTCDSTGPFEETTLSESEPMATSTGPEMHHKLPFQETTLSEPKAAVS